MNYSNYEVLKILINRGIDNQKDPKKVYLVGRRPSVNSIEGRPTVNKDT